jgi:hypothetical protein
MSKDDAPPRGGRVARETRPGQQDSPDDLRDTWNADQQVWNRPQAPHDPFPDEEGQEAVDVPPRHNENVIHRVAPQTTGGEEPRDESEIAQSNRRAADLGHEAPAELAETDTGHEATLGP